MQTEHGNCVFLLWFSLICLSSSNLVSHWNVHSGVSGEYMLSAQWNWDVFMVASCDDVSNVSISLGAG